MIDVRIEVDRPELALAMPADEDSLPIVRQLLRSLGEVVDAPRMALEDAELAVTEACANAVEHAYGSEEGKLEVRLCPAERGMEVVVRDYGVGIDAARADGHDSGYGLAMIEGIADDVVIRDGAGEGTELTMTFDLGPGAVARPAPQLVERFEHDGPAGEQPIGSEATERVLRRLVAVVAAQADLPMDRVTEALLVVELVARHGVHRLAARCVEVEATYAGRAIELRIGPFRAGSVDALVADSEVPVVGPVISRLADQVGVVDGGDAGEYLALTIAG